jgi:hypothetical protein
MAADSVLGLMFEISADTLAKILSDAVEQRDVKLTSSRALLPAYRQGES